MTGMYDFPGYNCVSQPDRTQLRCNEKKAAAHRVDMNDRTQPLLPARVVHVGMSNFHELEISFCAN
jgi:hypothetical protein